jgi:hypothetical protein
MELGAAGSASIDQMLPGPPPAAMGQRFPEWPGFSVAELPATGARTTPDVIEIVLEADVDRINVQAAIEDGTGRWFTPCTSHEIYRIGPAAQRWDVGEARVLPLAYEAELQDGFYALLVSLTIDGGQEIGTHQYLEVNAGVFRRASSEEFDEALYPRMVDALGRTYINALPPIDDSDPAYQAPCGTWPPYTDAIEEGAWTVVDLDRWVGGMIQPLRWQPARILEGGVHVEPQLVYHLRDAAGATLELRVPATTNEPAPVTTTGSSYALSLEEPGGPGEAPTVWYAMDGRVEVTVDGGELRVELTDVLLDKSRMYTDPPVRRTISGTISGRWQLDNSSHH